MDLESIVRAEMGGGGGGALLRTCCHGGRVFIMTSLGKKTCNMFV